MTLIQKFFADVIGKPIRFSGSSNTTPQCTDLAAVYNRDYIGAPNTSDANGAKDWWTNASRNFYTPIANTPSFVPIAGDIAVWSAALGNTYGHVAICTGEGNVDYFVSMDQNWGGQYAHYVRHNYTAIAGFLRPKKDVNFDQDAYNAQQATIAEANRIAAEKAKSAADDAAKAEAKRIADEQAQLAAEQERLAKELAEKIEADRLAEEAKLEIVIKEVPVESKKYSLNKEDLLKIGKGALIALSGALGAYVLSILNVIDAGVYTPLVVAGLSILANALVKFSSGK